MVIPNSYNAATTHVNSLFLFEFAAQNGSFSEDRSSIKISLKEVYLATDNLSASNFIGQGIAGK